MQALRFHLHKLRANFRQISADFHIDGLNLPAWQVKKLQRAELLDHDGIRSGRRRLEIKTIVLHNLADLFALRVIGEQAHGPIPVRQKIDRVPHPHGIEVVRVFARNLLDRRILEIGNPNRSRLPAAIMFPGALPFPVRNIR